MRTDGADALGALTLLITGAAGHVGRATVAMARARGHQVRAVVRRAGTVPPGWQNDPGIAVHVADLAQPEKALNAALATVDVVIHAAAAMAGSDAVHERDTVLATRRLVMAMPKGMPLVLVSSLAVYAGDLPPGSLIDETTPMEPTPGLRDAYCRAKLAQEEVARMVRGPLRIMRPGAVWGPGHLWNGHLGIALGPVLLRLGEKGPIPLCHVDHCALALILGAECRDGTEVVNVIDDDLPDRAQYIAALRQNGWPRLVVPLTWRLPDLVAARASQGDSFHRTSRLPGLLRRPTLRARMMPLRYDNAALHRLGWAPLHGFDAGMLAALEADR